MWFLGKRENVNAWKKVDFDGFREKEEYRGGGRKQIVGVFRVKNHDFTPNNHIFSNFRPPPGSAPGIEVQYLPNGTNAGYM